MPVSLHCELHGWHPRLQDVVLRLEALDEGPLALRAQLLERADAFLCGDGSHLVGHVELAETVLRSFEAEVLGRLIV